MNNNVSVATIDAPEFINITPYNPMISQCEIKVCYVGENRNGSYFSKEVLIHMADTLPGTPIVAAYRKDIDDFGDHGEILHIEDGEITFSVKTVPYGFVAPDAKVWFKKFMDRDELGNEVEHEYLMTTGYLWTGQFEEIKSVLSSGKGQSMELDPDSMRGDWAELDNDGMEFFIINDAVFSKLCILGDDVEPCFEGASVTSPEISKDFAKDESFAKTLFTMMNELKHALQDKGGLNMSLVEHDEAEVDEQVEEVEHAAATEESASEIDDTVEAEGEIQEDEVSDEVEPEDAVPAEEDIVETQEPTASAEPEFTVTQAEYDALLATNMELQTEVEFLRKFKLEVEDREKDQLIAKYFMLDDEDKADVIANKSAYTFDEIEAKLALIYVNKNVDFSTVSGECEDDDASDPAPSATFSLDDAVDEYVSGAVQALRSTIKNPLRRI